MEEKTRLVRALGLRESIGMTIGTVVGVGLFTCGSAQVSLVGPWIIVLTAISLLISIWPCLIYGEMAAALPCAGGTYNYAKRGLNRIWANIAGWNYIISVIGIGAGETLAFANYFTILFEQFGINLSVVDPRLIAMTLVTIFLILNLLGIKFSGKAQTGFIFFFWGCAIAWFLYMIPHVHLEYFGGFTMDKLPPFREIMYILGLVWWCYTGFETCCSMGAETKFPQYTLPRALKLSVFLVFVANALFQWFLVALVSPEHYGLLAQADAPYAEGLKAMGLVGFPVILLCIGIAFGGDLSTINPGIAAPARYIFTMAEDHTLPAIFAKIHPKTKTPYVALIFVGVVNYILIGTGSINYIASVSLFSLALCYMIGCAAYLGLKKKYPDMKRPYKAPHGTLGCIVTFVCYTALLPFVEYAASITGLIVCALAALYYFIFTKRHENKIPSLEEEIGEIDEPNASEKAKIDREYKIWKWGTIVATVISAGIYFIPMIFG